MNKSKLFAGLMLLVIDLSGTIAFANPVNVKTRKAHTRTVKIRVSENGFSPSSIEVEAGHKLNLVFNRADKNNCGNEVVFPKLNIRKTLPVKKNVIVSFTPTESGEITFTCGLGMYKGTIVVSED